MGVLEDNGWVAKPGQQAREVLSPTCFDGRLDANGTAELQQWHPLPDLAKYLIKHKAAKDTQGDFAHVAEKSNNWPVEMRTVLGLLKLRPQQGGRYLLDTNIANENTPLMSGWKVMRWLATKTVAPEVTKLAGNDLEEAHLDWITWQKGNRVVQTGFLWRVYED